MGRYRGPVCRLCRREGVKLFLKGNRCYKPSCAIEKRGTYPPGQHGRELKRGKLTGYGEQLREKQKVKRIYGIMERQFKNYFEKASRQRGIVGENLLILLERRLDNVVYRIGFATSRAHARQLVNHGHVLVNGKKVNIPSFQVKVGDVISIKSKSASNMYILQSFETAVGRGRPSWIEVDDKNALSARIVSLPRREDITQQINEQMIVELYSK
jgi:SSU ribosomal protein S4P